MVDSGMTTSGGAPLSTGFDGLLASLDELDTVFDRRADARRNAVGWAVDDMDHPTARAVVRGGVLTELDLPDYVLRMPYDEAEIAINGLILAAYTACSADYERLLDGED